MGSHHCSWPAKMISLETSKLFCLSGLSQMNHRHLLVIWLWIQRVNIVHYFRASLLQTVAKPSMSVIFDRTRIPMVFSRLGQNLPSLGLRYNIRRAQMCPMLWCRSHFETNDLTIRHILNCPQWNAWYWCPYHGVPECFPCSTSRTDHTSPCHFIWSDTYTNGLSRLKRARSGELCYLMPEARVESKGTVRIRWCHKAPEPWNLVVRELAECKTALVETCVGARAVDEFGLFRLLRNLLLLFLMLLARMHILWYVSNISMASQSGWRYRCYTLVTARM